MTATQKPVVKNPLVGPGQYVMIPTIIVCYRFTMRVALSD